MILPKMDSMQLPNQFHLSIGLPPASPGPISRSSDFGLGEVKYLLIQTELAFAHGAIAGLILPV